MKNTGNIQWAATECCPFCEYENEFLNYETCKNGYIVRCKNCGREIFLCDECLHSDDNVVRKCDFREYSENKRGCFRGIICW